MVVKKSLKISKKKRPAVKPVILTALVLLLLVAGVGALVWLTRKPASTPASCFEFESGTATIKRYRPGGEKCGPDVRIPDSIDGVAVKTIGTAAFRRVEMASVTLPKSITVIQSYAFAGNKIEKVELPAGLVDLGNAAFKDNAIKSVDIPVGVKIIKRESFANNQISSLALGDGVEMINDMAFKNNKLAELIVPESVLYIRSAAFAENQLKRLEIGAKVKVIGTAAFSGNSGLVEVKIKGEEQRFNGQWKLIGLPEELMPPEKTEDKK